MTLLPGADFSEWDGGEDHDRPLNWQAYTWPFTFIKVSQGLRVDPLFEVQWKAARGHVIRGAYHFFEPSQDPRVSALKTIEYLKGDLGEIPLVLDLERDEDMPNVLDRVKSWLSWYEARTSVRPIIYSSPSFLHQVKASSYPFLASYKLWLAEWPFDGMLDRVAREKRIADVVSGAVTLKWPSPPVPFKKVTFHQWTAQGKPGQVPGYTGGDAKKEVDLNFYNGTLEELRDEFGVSTETPTDPPVEPPIGDPMQGKVLRLTNLRADKNRFSTDLGDLLAGDIVTFTVKEMGSDSLNYYLLTSATRGGVPVKRTDGKTVAEANCWAYASNIEMTSTPAPTEDKPTKITIEMESGKVFVADQFTQQ